MRDSNQLRTSWTTITVISLLIICFVTAAMAYTPVEYGTVSLIKRFGGLTGTYLEPGLHWRIPFADSVVSMPTTVQSYETSTSQETSNADYTDSPVSAQTVDGQQISIKYTVLFRIQPENAVDVTQNIGSLQEIVENVVKAHSRNLARLWAQSHTAEDLYSGEGIFSYEDEVHNALQKECENYDVFLADFLVRKVDFDEDYIRAIEQQQIAEEAIETARYQSEAAEFEKASQIRLSEAAAEGTKLQAAADAERQRLLAEAEAYGIQIRGQTLREYPEIVQWEFVRNLESVRWGLLPSDGLTPLIPLPSLDEQEENTSLPAIPILPSETITPTTSTEGG